MSIGELVPLAPLMAQVEETHIDTCILSQTSFRILYFFTSNELKSLEKISDHIYVLICASVTCAMSGTSGTNLSMAISHPKMMLMLNKLGFRVIHGVNSKYTIKFCI